MIWDGSPILLSFGPLTVHWYGLLFGMGFLIGTQVVIRMFLREGLKTDKIDSLLLYMMFGTLIGARLGHTLIYEPQIYLHDPIRILKIWEGGLASHGGAVGVIFSIWLWSRKNWSRSFLELLDFLVIPGTLTGCLIRIGNFFNSEILGRPSDVPWAIVFRKVDSLPRHPSMLYESFAYLCTLLILGWMFNTKKHQGRPGLMFGTFLTLVWGARFLIEFLKEPQVASEVGMSLDFGQLLSIPFVALGIFLFVRALRMKPALETVRNASNLKKRRS